MKIRSGSTEKYARRASGATADYQAGIADPKADWATQTQAAEGAYKDGVNAAITRGAFGHGVKAAGTAKWQDKAATKGADRFASGVTAGVDDYQKGVQPYLDTLKNTSLPQRYAKGDPRNLARVAAVSTALRDKKLSMTGGRGPRP